VSVIFSLSFRNLARNKFRTLLTSLAIVVLVCVFTFVKATLSYVESLVVNEASQTRLLVTERWVAPSRFPARYVSELGALPGVEDWTLWNGALGYFDESRQAGKRALGMATRPDNILEMHPGLELAPDVLEKFQTTRDAAIMGQMTLDKMGWKVGQRFTFIPADPRRPPFELTIVGVIPPSRWEGNFFLRNDYFTEATDQTEFVNWVWLRVADTDAAAAVAREIEQQFGNRNPPLKVETESSGVARVAGRNQSALALVQIVSYVLLIDITLILANSMNIAARERQREIAVLKILGFTPFSIMQMVTFEAVVIGAIGGLAGALSAYGLAEALGGLVLRTEMFVTNIRIPEQMILTSPLIGALIGFVGSVYPAWTACRVKPTEVFVNVT
jgi:putative ABC transport system permease protein